MIIIALKMNKSYRGMAYSTETPCGEFFTFIDFSNLAERCEERIGDIVKCRTIGFLSSDFGKFYLNDLKINNSELNTMSDGLSRVRLSMLYMETAPQSAVIPYPVQVFGELQWKNRPVLFARIIQPMTVAMAIRMNKSLNDVTRLHLASNTPTLPMPSDVENEI